MDEREKDELSSVLGDIRKMVQDETRNRFTDEEDVGSQAVANPAPAVAAPASTPAPGVLVLGTDMLAMVKQEVSSSVAEVVREKSAMKVAGTDSDALQELVRHIVREELRGDLGKEIINTIKREL